MDLEQMIIRVNSEYSGGPTMTKAKDDVDDLETGVASLNKALLAGAAAFGVFAVAGVRAFADLDFAFTKFSGRAGMQVAEFKSIFARASSEIATATGLKHSLVLQGLQEGLSQGGAMGMGSDEVIRLVREASKLEATGQTDMLSAVSSAITARQYGGGEAADWMEMIYAASQVGAGDVAAYGGVFKSVAPAASALKMHHSETLGALALLGGAAPSLSEGGTWLNAIFTSLTKPTGPFRKAIKAKLGMDMEELRGLGAEEGGFAKILRMLIDNFTEAEISALTGRKEAFKGILALTKVEGQLENTQQGVRANAATGPIEKSWADGVETLAIIQQQFGRALDSFLVQYGAPAARMWRAAVETGTAMLKHLSALNVALGGLPAVIMNLVGVLLMLAPILIALRGALTAAKAVGGLVGRARAAPAVGAVGADVGRKAPGAAAAEGVRTFGPTTILAAALAPWRSAFAGIMGATKMGWQGAAGSVRGAPMAMPAGQGWQFRLAGVLQAVMKPLAFLTITPLGRMVTILAAVAGYTMHTAKNTDAVRKMRAEAARADSRSAHFADGGGESDAPAPGKTDVSRALTTQYGAAQAAAEGDLVARLRELNTTINDWMAALHPLLAMEIFDLDDTAEGIGTFLHGIFNDPKGAAIRGWEYTKRDFAALDTRIARAFLTVLGGAPSDTSQALWDQAGESTGGALVQTTLPISPEQLEAFGLETVGADILNAGNVNIRNLVLPGGVTPRHERAEWRGGPEIRLESNVTVNAETSADPKGVADAAAAATRTEMEAMAYELWQDTDLLFSP